MVGIIRIQGIVVADGGCHRQVFKSTGREIGCVLLLFWFSCLVHLIPCGNNKIQIRVLRNGNVQGAVPGKSVIAGRRVGCSRIRCQLPFSLGLSLGGANLRIPYIEDVYIFKASGPVHLRLGDHPVFIYRIIVGGILLQAGNRHITKGICLTPCQLCIHAA